MPFRRVLANFGEASCGVSIHIASDIPIPDSVKENERFRLVIAKTGSVNSGTVVKITLAKLFKGDNSKSHNVTSLNERSAISDKQNNDHEFIVMLEINTPKGGRQGQVMNLVPPPVHLLYEIYERTNEQ